MAIRGETKVSPEYEFVKRFANPQCWVLTAENLHAKAVELHSRYNKEIITELADGVVIDQWDFSVRPTALLAGFTLENMLKAFLVLENPQWVSNGRLSKQLKSHDLIALRDLSKMAPYKSTRHNCLSYFSKGVEGWARYPCGLDMQSTAKFRSIPFTGMWEWYLQIVQAYGRVLYPALGAGWKGPHGFSGSWSRRGDNVFEKGNP